MAVYWYVLRSKPHKEDFLWEQLMAREMEVYYPRLRVRPVNPRSRKVKPYFPGYMFVRLDLEQATMSAMQWLPGAAGLVMFDGAPPVVPDSLIASLRRHVDEVNVTDKNLFDGLKSGDDVVVQAGPFAGYEAIFDARISGRERVRVLLKMLGNRRLAVELPASQVHPKKRS